MKKKIWECTILPDMAANKKKKRGVRSITNSKEQFDVDCGSVVRSVEKGYSLKYRL